jgi:hypothetical protein
VPFAGNDASKTINGDLAMQHLKRWCVTIERAEKWHRKVVIDAETQQEALDFAFDCVGDEAEATGPDWELDLEDFKIDSASIDELNEPATSQEPGIVYRSKRLDVKIQELLEQYSLEAIREAIALAMKPENKD